jgi:hypothetical protein
MISDRHPRLRNSVRFASPMGRLTPQLAEDPYFLTIEDVDTENKIGLCMNLSFDRKVMLVVRVIYIYIL